MVLVKNNIVWFQVCVHNIENLEVLEREKQLPSVSAHSLHRDANVTSKLAYDFTQIETAETALAQQHCDTSSHMETRTA